jgi:hypothetical protein
MRSEWEWNQVQWYRVDVRGNKAGVTTQFTPHQEQLAYKIRFSEETDFQAILAEPLQMVVETLQARTAWDDMLRIILDLSLKSAKSHGLM